MNLDNVAIILLALAIIAIGIGGLLMSRRVTRLERANVVYHIWFAKLDPDHHCPLDTVPTRTCTQACSEAHTYRHGCDLNIA